MVFSINNTLNSPTIKHEADILNGWRFKSIVEIEENWPFDLPTSAIDEINKQNVHTTGGCNEEDKTSKYRDDTNCRNINTIKLKKTKSKKILNAPHAFECNECQKKFTAKSQVVLHFAKSSTCGSNVKHSNRKRTGKNSNSSNVNTRNDINRFCCDVCLKYFSYRSQLVWHGRVHTGETPFKCRVCAKSFTRNTNLKIHERVHTGEKPFKCTVCNKTFSQNNNLKRHELVHKGKNRFKCRACAKSFSTNGNLKTQERVHTEENPFKCCFCKKSFSQMSTLKSHEPINTGEALYKCSVCEKIYYNFAHMKIHERVHTGEKP
ncbi:zinc finger protein 239-like [Adelges cooleyi]|uniref:zinc finger protein 239-like n=1 Tax=Adelges cooleyi TaxID=133065 RepID=UPI0021806612|nr:zinc finger protein 239-like [Adelges cooleyi]